MMKFWRRNKAAAEGSTSIVVDGARMATGGRTRTRVVMTMAAFFSIYAAIGGRLVYFGFQNSPGGEGPASRVTASRPDIVDRNGQLLATDIKTYSLFAEPRRIVDADETIEKLTTVLPDLQVEQTYHKLRNGVRFCLAQAPADAETTGRHHGAWLAGYRLQDREATLLPGRSHGFAYPWSDEYRQPGHRRHGEIHRRSGARRPAGHRSGFRR